MDDVPDPLYDRAVAFDEALARSAARRRRERASSARLVVESQRVAAALAAEERNRRRLDANPVVRVRQPHSSTPVTSNTRCIICRELMRLYYEYAPICQTDDAVVASRVKACYHVFHYRCIAAWFARLFQGNQPLTCPICKETWDAHAAYATIELPSDFMDW